MLAVGLKLFGPLAGPELTALNWLVHVRTRTTPDSRVTLVAADSRNFKSAQQQFFSNQELFQGLVAVIDDPKVHIDHATKPALHLLPNWVTNGWISLWSIVGAWLGLRLTTSWKTITTLLLVGMGLIVLTCYVLVISGLWMPAAPTFLALTGTGSATAWLNARSRNLLEQRRLTIEQTFDAVHNGPLQSLALLYREVEAQEVSFETVTLKLEALDQEIRALYEAMEEQAISFSDYIHLDNELVLDLNNQLSELLFQVFEYTLSRPFPIFQGLRASFIPDFSPLDTCQLANPQKRGLCLFLEETLCNVGKYGHQVTYINVICRCTNNEYSIEVVNNNASQVTKETFEKGYGTRQSVRLAKQLNGRFQRFSGPNKTLHCQIKWNRNPTVLGRIKLAFRA